ncbi:MAG TPA: glycosyltransferase [Candidatus Limnocylindria bacterium]|nr:glycosyltransferase [Candidatus Limnocylindria bacterium]
MNPADRAIARIDEAQDPQPLVSVVLASRDGERFLSAALASIAAQTWPNIELLAVDDGSSDATGRLLESFAAEHPRTQVFHTSGLGPAAARSHALERARGSLVAVHDDDDVSHPERLERQVRHLLDHPETVLLGTAVEIIDERGRRVMPYRLPLDGAAIRRVLRRAPAFVHGSVMMRREAYLAAGGYRAPFRTTEDYDLYLRLPGDAGLANLSETLYSWRRHPGNSTAMARRDHLYFLAVARAFGAERHETGRDSIHLLARHPDPEAFLAVYPFAGRVLFYLGEAYVRDGRVGEARRFLRRAMHDAGVRAAALGWWALSFGVALTPRARAVRRPAETTR